MYLLHNLNHRKNEYLVSRLQTGPRLDQDMKHLLTPDVIATLGYMKLLCAYAAAVCQVQELGPVLAVYLCNLISKTHFIQFHSSVIFVLLVTNTCNISS